jgi:hypothetical protein
MFKVGASDVKSRTEMRSAELCIFDLQLVLHERDLIKVPSYPRVSEGHMSASRAIFLL